ncbi:hypothetical protein DLJ53_10370 [Acuticoccus sediminis]|uniref:Threonine/serine exporter family protein n=1 Tax=Acuticoccus sediminis TaxID=2184697 RepID=A0A8B2NWS4_9HYPH|nr:threonine/serine exporter family protein [Acuticoccus sediminis]RAI01802.1 hypothetical protein DLJ53_10370 [Acuticoccus sediminis]
MCADQAPRPRAAADPFPTADEVAHIALRLGRLMVVNGADSAHVEDAVTSFAAAHRYRARPLILPEGLLLTLEGREAFCTRLGRTIASPSVDMRALETLDAIHGDSLAPTADLAGIERRLDGVESGAPRYPGLIVALAMGVTAAALARLFGASAVVALVSAAVGATIWLLRLRLRAAGMNPIAAAALAAFGGGLLGSVAIGAVPDASPALCLVAGGLILVPSVPLLNGVRDALGRHVVVGLSRIIVASATILAIAFALFLAAAIAGDGFSIERDASPPGLPEELVMAALVGAGLALAFNVPARAAWGCMLCAIAGRGMRTACEGLGFDLVGASLVAAFATAVVARLIARRFRVPTVTFAFPGVVGMMPAYYAFRAGNGGLAIVHAGGTVSPALVGETLALAGTAILVTSAIAVGLSMAFATPLPGDRPHFGR